MARPTPTVAQLSKEDVKYLERQLSSLPASKSDAGSDDADGLLKYGYHQNPYVRTFAKVLWSGFAIARNQLADGHQRFTQARRDATVSAVDAVTTQAMDSATQALENAMAPDGSLTHFLAELRDKTVPRLWTRVCETAGLPPPSFRNLYGKRDVTPLADIDAQEEVELAALRKTPAAPAPVSEDDDLEDDEEDEDDDGGAASAATAALHLTVARQGGADTVAELVLSAATELLRELRAKSAQGSVKVTLTLEGQGRTEGGGGGGRKRRRRRR
jgi:hypothetical protein